MKKIDLAYIAGFFDGEGCINISRVRNPKSPQYSIQYSLKVIVGSTDEWACRRLKFMFGGNITKQQREENSNQKLCYHWQASSKIAGEFLKAIYPYLHLKRDRAEIAIEFQKASSLRGSGKPLTDKERALREVQRLFMKKANQRGKLKAESYP